MSIPTEIALTEICDAVLESLDTLWEDGIQFDEIPQLGQACTQLYEYITRQDHALSPPSADNIEKSPEPGEFLVTIEHVQAIAFQSLHDKRYSERVVADWRNVYTLSCLLLYVHESWCYAQMPHFKRLRRSIELLDRALLLGGTCLRDHVSRALNVSLRLYAASAEVQELKEMDMSTGHEALAGGHGIPMSERVPRLRYPLPRIVSPSLQSFDKNYRRKGDSGRPIILVGCMGSWGYYSNDSSLCVNSRHCGDNLRPISRVVKYDENATSSLADEAAHPDVYLEEGGVAILDDDCALVEKDYQNAIVQSSDRARSMQDGWVCKYWHSSFHANRLLSDPTVAVRVVPIEVGKHYLDGTWTRVLMHFDDFVRAHICHSDRDRQPTSEKVIDYLAQHQLLDRIPTMATGVGVPDYTGLAETDRLEVNVWIGPQGNITPLHYDNAFNFLCQVGGFKYVRLYSPQVSEQLYPCTTA